tara:strand:- start:655 stop:1236 length:582 start_codon:yes stop_codon:yes gene_type:complete
MNIFSDFINGKFDIFVTKHADLILKHGFPDEYDDLSLMLENFSINIDSILKGGGGKSEIATGVDEFLIKEKGWEEKLFNTFIQVDNSKKENPTHKIDCYKNRVAFELEWNNKTEFYDRDLNNFRILNELDAISLGIIMTRSTSLNTFFKELNIYPKYGTSTTHSDKLIKKINGGGAGGCPLIVFSIKKDCFYD